MLKKIILICLLCILMVSITIMNQFFMDLEFIGVFKSYVASQLKVSGQMLNDYYGNDVELSGKASKDIIETTLINLEYNHWLEYIDYIDLKIYLGNVIPGNEEELIVALNLSKDIAALGVYTKVNEEYIYASSLKNIVPLQEISFIPVPQEDYCFIVTEQILDERVGAFFIDQFIEIFLYTDNGFKSVWKGTKFSQEIYNERWINPDSPSNKWVKIINNNKIHIINTNRLTINNAMLRQRFVAISPSMPKDEDFQLNEEILTGEVYYWNPEQKQFIMVRE